MSYAPRRKLSIPELLVVSAFGVVAGCGDDATGDTGNESGPATTAATSTDSTTGPEGTSTDVATTTGTGPGDSTGGSTETDTGALPDCQATPEQAACEATMSCVFRPEHGGCIIDCTIVEDEATCVDEIGCYWYGDLCDFEPVA
jgi:hypothetical protein